MFQPAPIPMPPLERPDQQKNGDFTANASPLPGKVAKAVPVTPGKEVKPVSRLPLTVPGAHPHSPSIVER